MNADWEIEMNQKSTTPPLNGRPVVRSAVRQQRKSSGLMALEQRFMFDGAGAVDALQTASPLDAASNIDVNIVTSSQLVQAEQLAQKKVIQFVSQASEQELFKLFNGGQSAPDAIWTERLGQIRQVLSQGEAPVQLLAMDQASQLTAIAAFASNGPEGKPTIFVNPFWMGLMDDQDISNVLIEELGHWMDSVLNPGFDTPQDEGENFARVVVGQIDGTSNVSASDAGWVTVDGVSYAVEFASFNFTNAYEMVYDLNNNTNTSGGVVNAAIDTNERWSDKEQNLHYFNVTNPLGTVRITDGTGNQNFSGNDVSATSIVVGGNTYNGWISRPIKANGVVRGFYFWTDADFVDRNGQTGLYWAQQDGNQDGDSSVLDNRGFLLVVDQSWFDSQARTNYSINNLKDGNLGAISVASVGSSSDRVDSALNSVLTANSAPLASNDKLTVNEDSGTTTVSAATGLLSNDTDSNLDALTITSYSISGVSGPFVLGSPTTITGVGSITINADGSYSFTPLANYNGTVPPISYTVSDGKGGSSTAVLSITVAPVNDAPQPVNDTATTPEDTPISKNILANDTDPDGDALTVTQFSFQSNGSTVTYSASSTTRSILDSSGNAIGTIQITSNGNYTFTPASNWNGVVPTITYTVSDGTTTATATLALTVTTANDAPTAGTLTANAVEAGCDVAGSGASGDLLSGASDENIAGLTISKVINESQGSSTNSNGSTEVYVQGLYGKLYFQANGAYRYVLDNDIPAVDSLNSSSTPTDVFYFTVKDTANLTSSSTLTITIQGSNDRPTANDDFSQVAETVLTNGNYGTVTGNALSNDTDVDNTTLTISGSYATATGSAAGSSTYTFTTSNSVGVGDYVFFDDDGSATTKTLVAANTAATGEIVRLTVNYNGSLYNMLVANNSAGATTFKIVVSGVNQSVSLNDNSQGIVFNNGTNVGFGANADPSTGLYKTSSISGSTNPSSTTVNITNLSSGAISAGMSVTATLSGGGTETRTVQSVTKNTSGDVTAITVNSAVTWSGASLSFSSTASPLTLTGQYGNISINTTTGAYTYTLTSNSLADGSVFVEKFNYRATDSSCTDDAVINIRITGASAPSLINDSVTVAEDSGAYVSGTADLRTNDSNGSNGVTLGNITQFQVDGAASAVTAGTQTSIAGVGLLTINADGTFVFDPVDNYTGPVPVIRYDRLGSDNVVYSAYLTISIQAGDDPPAAQNDIATVPEDQAKSGNLLTNDSHPDGTSFSVTAFSYLSNGSLVTYSPGSTAQNILDASGASVGTIQIASNGAYTFTPSTNWSGVVPVISYTITDADGDTATATLTLTMAPAADPPVNTVPAAQTLTNVYESTLAFSSANGNALSVSDADGNIRTIVLGANYGTLTVSNTGYSAQVSVSNNGSGTVTLTVSSDNQAALNAVLDTLTYTATGHFVGNDVLTIQTTDATTATDFDSIAITVNPDNRLVTVKGSVVNEASPYVMFEVSGAEGQWISLSLSETTNANGNATTGLDFLPNLQYFDGTNWVNYTSGLIQIPDTSANNGKLLVRTAILQDNVWESTLGSYETLKLTAKNAAGTANITTNAGDIQADGTAKILDNGQGSVFLSSNNGTSNAMAANVSGDAGYPTYLDDDRPVTVNNIAVNEASPWAMFTVTGYANQVLSLSLLNGTATAGDGNPADGTEDYSPDLEYWDGAAWTAYNSSVTMSGTTLLVRTAIHQDTLFEGQHTFNLSVTKLSSNTAIYGTASIYDDGTGDIYDFDNINDGTATITSGPGVGFDDDRGLIIDSPVVNEGSNYVVFTLTGNSGQTVSLQLLDESNSGAVQGKADILENQTLKIWDGQAWVNYNADNLPTFDANHKVFVRVDIVAEQDTSYEGGETFKLNATLTGRTTSATGVATIIDDGTGVKYPGTFTNGTPDTISTSLDDDRFASVSVNSISVNEGSPYAVFTVTGAANQSVTLALSDGTAVGGATSPTDGSIDFGTSLQYWNGTAWTAYTAGAQVNLDANGKLLVRNAIVNDGVYEGAHTYTLSATNSGGTSSTGTGTIVDDGTGTYFPDANPTNSSTPSTDPSITLNDDRTVSVSAYGPVNEGSPYAMFKVDGIPGNSMDIGLQAASSGKAATISGFTFQFSTDGGLTWTTYDASNKPTVPAGGSFFVRVNIASEADSDYEGAETFSLKANYSNNTSKSAAADSSIIDDGTGTRYDGSLTSSMPASSTQGLDDDRPRPIVRPVPSPAPAAPVVVAPEPAAPLPVALPKTFNSAVQPLANKLAPPPELPTTNIGDILTSNSGFPIIAIDNAPPGLTINKGITDQFVEQGASNGKFSVPYDAFVHSKQDAVISLQAKQGDDAPLPAWVRFDPQAGTFEVNPPANFKGKVELKVVARDDDGREATSIFRLFIGDETTDQSRPQSRNSLSEKIRLAAKRPAVLSSGTGEPAVPVAPSLEMTGRPMVIEPAHAG